MLLDTPLFSQGLSNLLLVAAFEPHLVAQERIKRSYLSHNRQLTLYLLLFRDLWLKLEILLYFLILDFDDFLKPLNPFALMLGLALEELLHLILGHLFCWRRHMQQHGTNELIFLRLRLDDFYDYFIDFLLRGLEGWNSI